MKPRPKHTHRHFSMRSSPFQGNKQLFITVRDKEARAGAGAVKPTAEQLAAHRAALGQRQPHGATGAGPSERNPTSVGPPSPEAETALRLALEDTRCRLAEEAGTLAAAVLTDDQVCQLAERRPTSARQLAVLIGEAKAELWGGELLRALHGGVGSGDGVPQQQQQQQQQQEDDSVIDGELPPQQQQQPEQQQQQGRQPANGKPRRPASRNETTEVIMLASSEDDEVFDPAPSKRQRG